MRNVRWERHIKVQFLAEIGILLPTWEPQKGYLWNLILECSREIVDIFFKIIFNNLTITLLVWEDELEFLSHIEFGEPPKYFFDWKTFRTNFVEENEVKI